METAPLKSKNWRGLIIVNGLTFLRLVCAVVIWQLLRQQGYIDLKVLTIGLFGGFTDVLDGWLANPKRLNVQSKFGALSDKGVDKIFILVIVFSLYFYCSPFPKNPLASVIGFLLIILTGMEFLLAIFGGIFSLMKNSRLEANWWGKIKMWAEGMILSFWGACLMIDPTGNLLLENIVLIVILFLFAIGLAGKSGYDYYRDAKSK